jgi:tRNA threonylcarbamoyladenosine biosynthesis protein TsaB
VAGLTLAMDAAAGDGTIAVLRGGEVLAEQRVMMRSADEERFLPAVIEALRSAGGSTGALERIVCGSGPGSFTALRVVAAAAKGLAMGLEVPLFAVSSLALTVAASETTKAPGSRWLSVLDALRGDQYLALVEVGAAGAIASVEALGLAPAAEIGARAAAREAHVIGPEAAPHARGVARCAALIDATGPVDLERWEPVYGRLAEAQVKWEAAQGRPLPTSPARETP